MNTHELHKRLESIAAALLDQASALMGIADDLVKENADIDALYLARAIQGEGAASFGDMRDQVGTLIGEVAVNRLETGWWGDSMVDIVTSAFHGYVNVEQPAAWAISLAQAAMHREEDHAQGCLFVLSGGDLKKHGWNESDAVFSVEHDGFSLHFFREWPGKQSR